MILILQALAALTNTHVCPAALAARAALLLHIVVPCTTYRAGRRLYPSQVVLRAPNGGLDVDSVALGEQVRALATSRLSRRRGQLSPEALMQLEHALLIALDLPGAP